MVNPKLDGYWPKECDHHQSRKESYIRSSDECMIAGFRVGHVILSCILSRVYGQQRITSLFVN